MTADDLRAVASRIVEKMVREHPAESATIASLVLSEKGAAEKGRSSPVELDGEDGAS
jgi:hypothetical protein